jgi:hypothetical protein
MIREHSDEPQLMVVLLCLVRSIYVQLTSRQNTGAWTAYFASLGLYSSILRVFPIMVTSFLES